MSFLDKVKDVLKGDDKHSSWITDLGKQFDVFYHITGGDDGFYHKILNEKLPEESNRLFSDAIKPFAKADKKINPLRRIDVYDDVATWTENKPVDTAAAIIGAYFGGSALAGMGGGGAGGAGGTAGSSAGGAGGSGVQSAFSPKEQIMKGVGGQLSKMNKQNQQQQQPITPVAVPPLKKETTTLEVKKPKIKGATSPVLQQTIETEVV